MTDAEGGGPSPSWDCCEIEMVNVGAGEEPAVILRRMHPFRGHNFPMVLVFCCCCLSTMMACVGAPGVVGCRAAFRTSESPEIIPHLPHLWPL